MENTWVADLDQAQIMLQQLIKGWTVIEKIDI